MSIRHPVHTAALALLAATLVESRIQSPVIVNPHAGDQTVAGTAATDAVPIAIYDTSESPQRLIGQGVSIDVNGNFAVVVTPLVVGHSLVAIDARGESSEPVPVTAAKGPGGGGADE